MRVVGRARQVQDQVSTGIRRIAEMSIIDASLGELCASPPVMICLPFFEQCSRKDRSRSPDRKESRRHRDRSEYDDDDYKRSKRR